MTRKLILAAVLMLSFTMVSCNSNKSATSENSSESSSSVSKTDSNEKAESTAQDKDSNETKSETKPQESAKTDEASLSIYTINDNTLEPNELKKISIDSNLSINDKLTKLADNVSKSNFDGLPIKIKSIDTVNGKSIATINLVDSSSSSWVQKFQGSTGGQVTANTLIENFLQTSNKSKGDWVDGVKFLYNDEPIEYDHVADLSNIQYAN